MSSRSSTQIVGLTALIVTVACGGAPLAAEPAKHQVPWARHTIDDSFQGADGVRLADANGDGLLDIATGWEQSGVVRLYLHPGHDQAKERWPAVTVGNVASPEDAVLVDLDGDGALDIVSCCEGKAKSVYIHWAPRDQKLLLEETAWTTEAFASLAGKFQAMYCVPVQIDGQHGIDLVVGGKGKDAQIGWLESPANPRNVAGWQWHPLCEAGWVMSLVAVDVDVDGDRDILASDRKGKHAGCLWLENPGTTAGEALKRPWKRRRFGPPGIQVMFLDVEIDSDKRPMVIVPTYDKRLFRFHQSEDGQFAEWWDELDLPEGVGNGKGIRIANVDLDGKDLVLSTENYEGTSGLVWMRILGTGGGGTALQVHDIAGPAGPKGMKLDDIQIFDVDGDGDQDVLTTEERTGWGVVWFENPTR